MTTLSIPEHAIISISAIFCTVQAQTNKTGARRHVDSYQHSSGKRRRDRRNGASPPSPVAVLRAAVTRLRRHLPTHIPVAVKLAVSISVTMTVGMSLLGAFIIRHQTELLNRNMLTFGHTVVAQMAQSAKEPVLANDTLQLEVLAANLANSENVVGTAIYGADRKLLTRSGAGPFELNAPYAGHSRAFLDNRLETLQWKWPNSPRGALDAMSFVSPIRFRDMTVGYAEISFSRALMTESLHASIRSIVLTTIALILAGIAVSYLLGRRLSRPLHHLMDASRAIGNGQYHYRIEERRNDEIGYLMTAFNSMAQGMLQKTQVEEAFSKYVPARVAKQILANLDQVRLSGTHAMATVMFVDIVGFTAKSETMEPEGVAELLNEFYTTVGQAAALHRGTIDKYMGDCVMLVFGIPEEDPDHTFNAVACAVFFQKLVARMNDRRISQGKFPVHFRIGINAGDMLAGVMGSSDRVQYTVVGDTVNLASRLCSVATADQIVITEETFHRGELRKRISATKHGSIRIRGKSQPVSVFLVHDVHAALLPAMDRQIADLLEQT